MISQKTMRGILLPGDSTVDLREFPVPEPGPGQVVLAMKASSICGSDIRAIYREHLGKGPEAYQGVIAGHEPCGQVAAVGVGVETVREGDRVVVYHISGCGLCDDCRRGYQISCTSPRRAAYGWQRDGGHADFMLADEADLVPLPEPLTYLDGALCACGFGTCYEALTRVAVSGLDRVLVVGLGPVGLAAAMLARAMGASRVWGVDVAPDRVELARRLNLVDEAWVADAETFTRVMDATGGTGAEVTVDCSGHPDGRALAIHAARQWGRVAFVGEGGTVSFEPSPAIIHKQITIYGSWVTSVPHLRDLIERLVHWGIHPEHTATDRFDLNDAARAYELMDRGGCGKVSIVWPED